MAALRIKAAEWPMNHLIDREAQFEVSRRINGTVARVVSQLHNHGSEEGLTPVLGRALMDQSFESADLKVDFRYRQASKYTEEPHGGLDGWWFLGHRSGELAETGSRVERPGETSVTRRCTQGAHVHGEFAGEKVRRQPLMRCAVHR